jgi:D-alanyl-lipoteichoic acid acyltransferase DltB (MBOAT superfamily)
VLTFVAVTLGWVFFRAETLGRAVQIFGDLAGLHGLGSAQSFPPAFMVSLAAAAAIAFFFKNSWELELQPRPRYAYALAVMLVASVLLLGGGSPFLYFQF